MRAWNFYLIAVSLSLAGCSDRPLTGEALEFERLDMNREHAFVGEYVAVTLEASGHTELISLSVAGTDTVVTELPEARVAEWERLLHEADFLNLEDNYACQYADMDSYLFTVTTQDTIKSVIVCVAPVTVVPVGLEMMTEEFEELVSELKESGGG